MYINHIWRTTIDSTQLKHGILFFKTGAYNHHIRNYFYHRTCYQRFQALDYHMNRENQRIIRKLKEHNGCSWALCIEGAPV